MPLWADVLTEWDKQVFSRNARGRRPAELVMVARLNVVDNSAPAYRPAMAAACVHSYLIVAVRSGLL